MTRILALALIVLAVLLGVLALALGHRPPPPAPIRQPVAAAPAMYPVVVAARSLPAGQPITFDALRVQAMSARPAGSYADAESLINRVPSVTIAPDAPVLGANLVNSIALELQPGERAVAVHVDEANTAGWQVRPGNMVDVFYTLRRSGDEIDRSQTRLVVSKVRVLAYGAPARIERRAGANGVEPTNDAADTNHTPGGSGSGNALSSLPRTAVLAVPVEDVDALVLAESAGRLVLALRNPADPDTVDARAFGPPKGLLKTVDNVPVQGATQAARGLALDQLTDSSGARPGFASGLPPLPVAVPPRVRVSGTGVAGSNGVEVIRGERVATMAR